MLRTLASVAALCLAASVVGAPDAVRAEPKLLTPAELDSISAGVDVDIDHLTDVAVNVDVDLSNIPESLDGLAELGFGNLAIVTQVAIANATAFAIAFDGDAEANAAATAVNFSLRDILNF